MSSDAEMYLSSLPYNKPGTLPLGFSTEVVDGCPRDCGLCLRVAQEGHEDSGDKRGEPEGGEK